MSGHIGAYGAILSPQAETDAQPIWTGLAIASITHALEISRVKT